LGGNTFLFLAFNPFISISAAVIQRVMHGGFLPIAANSSEADSQPSALLNIKTDGGRSQGIKEGEQPLPSFPFPGHLPPGGNQVIFRFRRWRQAMNLKVILEPSDEEGFTAIVPALPGCISEGDTREEALGNIREAIQLYLEEIDPFPHS
jgi:predicted RNase H-like HicB family nuclease